MVTSSISRVGILTAGGDCPGLNAVIRAFVKTAESQTDWEILGVLDARRDSREIILNRIRSRIPG